MGRLFQPHLLQAPEDGLQYARSDGAWEIVEGGTGGGGGIEEAPIDGQQYARSDAAWEVVVGGSGGGSADWADITGKPSTFPPTLPIAQSGVTNLTTDLAAIYPGLGPYITSIATNKATLVNADDFIVSNSEASDANARFTWLNMKANIKTYADTLYAAITHSHTTAQVTGLDAAQTAQDTAIAGKEPALPAGGTTSTFLRGDKTWATPAGGGGSTAWADITGKPATFPPDVHTHAYADITGKPTLGTAAARNIHVGTSAPGSPATNDIWIDTT